MSDKNQISYINFKEADIPQPFEKLDSNGWVKWGSDNLYPQFLLGLYYNSPIHSGIINSKVKYITAGGLDYEGSDLMKWEQIKKNGSAKYDLDELAVNFCKDNELLDEFYIKCVKNISTGLWEFDILDSELMRNDSDGVYYYFSECWQGQQSEAKTKLKKYISFQYRNDTTTECVLHISSKSKQFLLDNGKLTSNNYPICNYSGAIVSIMADIEMNNFHFSESVNGFTNNTIVSLLNGVPEPDEKKRIEQEFKSNLTDSKKKGGATILYADGKDREPTITQLATNDLDKRYLETQRFIADSIMIAHGVINPALFGMKTAGQLGSTQELETSFLIFKQNYSVPRGLSITEALTYVNQKLNDLTGRIFYKDYTIQLTPSSDTTNATGDALNLMSPLLANKVLSQLTINEIRALAKLSPVTNGDIIPSDTSTPTTFKSEDKILNQLMNVGCDASSLTFVKSIGVTNFDNLEFDEAEILKLHKIEKFAGLTAEEKKILALIDKNVSFDNLVKEIGKDAKYIGGKLLELESKGNLLRTDGKLSVSKLGKSEIEQTEYKIYYTYEKRPDAPDLVKGGESREFCVTLLKANKAFLRSEIENINNDEGTNVWLYRGGWYHDPTTDKNQPSCRHYWKMNVVIA